MWAAGKPASWGDHLDFLHDQSGGAARLIDKLPHNHRFLGLIERLSTNLLMTTSTFFMIKVAGRPG